MALTRAFACPGFAVSSMIWLYMGDLSCLQGVAVPRDGTVHGEPAGLAVPQPAHPWPAPEPASMRWPRVSMLAGLTITPAISRAMAAGFIIRPTIPRNRLNGAARTPVSSWNDSAAAPGAAAKPWRDGGAILSAVRSASAMMVTIGLAPSEVGQALASPTHTPFTSKSSPLVSATLMAGSLPIRQVLSWWALIIGCAPS